MLSSDEIRNYELKKGIGYSRRSVDRFIAEIVKDYEEVCKENIELKDKAAALSEGLQYYKSIEKTLQKALVLAQKASDEEYEKAAKKARTLEKTARTKADEVITKAKSDLDTIFRQTDDLNRRFELYKTHVKNLITTQLDLINSDAYNISINDLEGYLKLKGSLEDLKEITPEDKDEEIKTEKAEVEEAKKETKSEVKSDEIKPQSIASDDNEKKTNILKSAEAFLEKAKGETVKPEHSDRREQAQRGTEHKESPVVKTERPIVKPEGVIHREAQERQRNTGMINPAERARERTAEKRTIPHTAPISRETAAPERENLINCISSETVTKEKTISYLQTESSEVDEVNKKIPANGYGNGESGYEQNFGSEI